MVNYVNPERIVEWYKSVSKRELKNENELLYDAYIAFCSTGKGEYTVPAAYSKTGKDETYKFSAENIGCCGASTIYVHF